MITNFNENNLLNDDPFSELFDLDPVSTGIKFSYFLPSIKNVVPQFNVSLPDLFEMIKTDFFKNLTDQVRSNPALKSVILPYVTPSGIFKKRNISELISYTGIICIDLDNCDINIKDTLAGDSFLNFSLVFVSPSGTGLKLFVSIDNPKAENHYLYFTALAKYLFTTCGLVADKSCNDIPRACFLCQ